MKLSPVQSTNEASANIKSPPRKANIMRGRNNNHNHDVIHEKNFVFKTVGVQNVKHFLQNIDNHHAQLMKRHKFYLYANLNSKSYPLKGQRMITKYFKKTEK